MKGCGDFLVGEGEIEFEKDKQFDAGIILVPLASCQFQQWINFNPRTEWFEDPGVSSLALNFAAGAMVFFLPMLIFLIIREDFYRDFIYSSINPTSLLLSLNILTPTTSTFLLHDAAILLPLVLALLLNLLPPTDAGDILKRTMCFCGTDEHKTLAPRGLDLDKTFSLVQGEAKRGLAPRESDHKHHVQTFWFVVDFYNAHVNRTFVMEETCESHYKGKHNRVGRDCWDYKHSHHKYCKHFHVRPHEKPARHGRLQHHLCYHFHPDSKRDSYSFDGQRRQASRFPLFKLNYEVREICEPICRDKFDLPMMKGRWHRGSSVSTIFDQADMCPHCA